MEIAIRIAGEAGQGMQTTAELLGLVATRAGLFAHCRNDAESRIRGGLNFAHLRISQKPVAGTSEKVNILIAQSSRALEELGAKLPAGALVLSQKTTEHAMAAPFSLEEAAKEAGSDKAAGTVALGAVCSLLGVQPYFVETAIKEKFGRDPELLSINQRAADLGARLTSKIQNIDRFRVQPQGPPNAKRLWISGSEAVALGAVAGGVGFFAGYPMSPATGIMNALAKWEKEALVHVEQAEDEIAAINMVSGASFAGARSMTATSGGGYCLMTEGVSLLGMIEAPAVIALSQRPGPATGLPTRMAQGDLNLVRCGGHGYFPKIILAPKNIFDAFETTATAFDLAERFQSPVYVLTDQLINDGRVTCEHPEISHLPSIRHYLSPDELNENHDYRRYAWSDDGLSPMAMPGKSKRLVRADSDEHDEWGHITESGVVAEKMFEKRRAKERSISKAAWAPEIFGDANGKPLVVSWGSTYETLRESMIEFKDKAAHMHLRWLWPLPQGVVNILKQAPKIIAVENSPTVELASILRESACRSCDAVVGKRDGRPFSVEELQLRIDKEALK